MLRGFNSQLYRTLPQCSHHDALLLNEDAEGLVLGLGLMLVMVIAMMTPFQAYCSEFAGDSCQIWAWRGKGATAILC